MKKLALLSVSASALVTASGMALAADLSVPVHKAYIPQPCCDSWTGIYIGAYFGSGGGTAKQTFTQSELSTFADLNSSSNTTTTTVGSLSGKATGSVVDAVVGGNWQPSTLWVLGAQVEGTAFSDITLKPIGTRTQTRIFTSSFPNNNSTTVRTNTTETFDELRSMFAFIGRAGYLVTPDVLIYGLGGGVVGNFVIPSGQNGEDTFGGRRSVWKLGYTVGAGGEYRVNKNWFIRGEYRFIHFKIDRDNNNFNVSSVSSTNPSTNTDSFTRNQSTNFDFHLGKIGFVYKFCPSWCS